MTAVSRRDFLRTSLLSGAGLVIAFYVPVKARAAAPAHAKAPPPPPNAFVRVAPDGSVTVLLAHSEMGQRIWTTLAMLIAEELECDWGQVRVEHAPAAPVYAHTAMGMQMTGGSTTVRVAFAWAPVPALPVITIGTALKRAPAAVPCTWTVIVQDPLTGMVPPVSARDEPPAAVVTGVLVPTPQ
jgi:hypothetical protein